MRNNNSNTTTRPRIIRRILHRGARWNRGASGSFSLLACVFLKSNCTKIRQHSRRSDRRATQAWKTLLCVLAFKK